MLVPLWKSTARSTLFLAVHFALATPPLWGEVLTVGVPGPAPYILPGWDGGGRVWPLPTWVQYTSGCVGCFSTASCLQPMDEGSCRNYVLLWYYHAEANACRPFIFGGCRGNSNRFETKWRCERRCKTSAGKAAPEPSNPPLPPARSEVKAGKPTRDLPTSVDLWCPTRTERTRMCASSLQGFAPIALPAHFGLPQPLLGAPGHLFSLVTSTDGMWVDL